MTDAAERLRRRYPKPRMPRPLMVALIGVGVVLGLTWLVWTALLHSRPTVAAHVQAFDITSDSSVSVTLAVERRDPVRSGDLPSARASRRFPAGRRAGGPGCGQLEPCC